MLQVLEGLQDGQKLPQQLQGQQRQLQACGHMEAAAQALDVGRVAGAQHHLEAAEQCLGVSSEVTGKTLSPCSNITGRAQLGKLNMHSRGFLGLPCSLMCCRKIPC